MQEIEISGNKYRSGKLNAIQQFHLSRKLAPIVTKLAPVLGIGRALQDKQVSIEDLPELAEAVEPLMAGLAAMSNEDSEAILDLCMTVVTRNQGPLWAPVWNSQIKGLMFQDIDMVIMLRLAVAVIRDNLGPFIAGFLADKDPAAKSPAA